MAGFNIDDLVFSVVPVGHRQVVGARGTVVGFDDGGYIAVEFDEDIGGSEIDDIEYEDEDYECPDGHGWFVLPGDITHVVSLDDIDIQEQIDLF